MGVVSSPDIAGSLATCESVRVMPLSDFARLVGVAECAAMCETALMEDGWRRYG